MGKITYRPKKNHAHSNNGQKDIASSKENAFEKDSGNKQEIIEQEPIVINTHREKNKHIDNIKVVGDMDCEYHVYLEDYVYTYIYQYAFSDLSRENSAVLIGEIYTDSKEAVIRGIIPVEMDKLLDESEWINREVLEEIERQRAVYFEGQDIIGWMHMQPGYGTMLTMKELREHKNVFEGNGSLCMLVDAINKIETVFVFEEEELKEQGGYCMYYERNEQMQRYMLDHPFSKKETEEIKDTVVNQFREIGKIRKAEYIQRKSVSFTVITAGVILVALTGVIVKMNDARNLGGLIGVSNNPSQEALSIESPDSINFIINDNSKDAEASPVTGVQENIDGDLLSDNEALSTVEIKMGEEAVNPNESAPVVNEKVTSEEVDQTKYEVYIVQAGDTLADISYSKYGEAKKSRDIAKFNEIENTDSIYIGQELKLPIYE